MSKGVSSQLLITATLDLENWRGDNKLAVTEVWPFGLCSSIKLLLMNLQASLISDYLSDLFGWIEMFGLALKAYLIGFSFCTVGLLVHTYFRCPDKVIMECLPLTKDFKCFNRTISRIMFGWTSWDLILSHYSLSCINVQSDPCGTLNVTSFSLDWRQTESHDSLNHTINHIKFFLNGVVLFSFLKHVLWTKVSVVS